MARLSTDTPLLAAPPARRDLDAGRFAWVPEPVYEASVSPGGRWVTASHEGRFAVYERSTHREVCNWPHAPGRGACLGWWCADDALLLATSAQGRARLARVEVPDGGEVATREGSLWHLLAVAPRGDLVAVLMTPPPYPARSRRPPYVEVFDALTLAPLREVEFPPKHSPTGGIWMRPDGAALLVPVANHSVSRERLAVVNLVRGTSALLAPLLPRAQWHAWLGPTRVLRGSHGFRVDAVDLETGARLWELQLGTDGGPTQPATALSPDRDRVACVYADVSGGWHARLLDASTGKETAHVLLRGVDDLTRRTLRWRRGEALEGLFTAHGRWWLGRWSLATGERMWELPLAFPPGVKRPHEAIAHAAEDGGALAWEVGQGRWRQFVPRYHVGWCAEDA